MTIEDAAELCSGSRTSSGSRAARRRRGRGRGDDPRPAEERAADAARPDRDRRGARGRALDLLTALNTGHEGALSTVHANSPATRWRVETLALMAGLGLPHEAIRDQLRRGIDLVVHLARRPEARGAWSRSPRSDADETRPGAARAACSAARAGGLAGAGGARGGARRPAAAGCRCRWSRCAGRGARATRPAMERRRLAALGAGSPRSSVAGCSPGRRGAAARPRRPGLAAWAVSRRRRYRRAVEAGSPRSPTAVADSLTAGARCAARCPPRQPRWTVRPPSSWGGWGPSWSWGRRPAPRSGWRRRSIGRVDAFAAALLSQRLAGGDLAELLRRFAAGAAERDRVADDARSATAQARFTGLLVVAMPSGGALFAELIQPGFLVGAGRPGLRGAGRPRGGSSIRRLRRDPPPLAGG